MVVPQNTSDTDRKKKKYPNLLIPLDIYIEDDEGTPTQSVKKIS